MQRKWETIDLVLLSCRHHTTLANEIHVWGNWCLGRLSHYEYPSLGKVLNRCQFFFVFSFLAGPTTEIPAFSCRRPTVRGVLFKGNNDSNLRNKKYVGRSLPKTRQITHLFGESDLGNFTLPPEKVREKLKTFLLFCRWISPTLTLSCKSDWTNIGFFTFSSFIELVPIRSVI